MPHYIALLAEAGEIAGQFEEAVGRLDDALQIVDRTGERWFAAELNRHKGELLLRQGYSEAAEQLYCKALRIAEEQEAKLWELRAAVSLARLRRDQGRRAEARELPLSAGRPTDATRPLGWIGLADDDYQPGEIAVRDEGFRAIDCVLVAVPLGARADRLEIRSGARLGHRYRANQFAFGEARQIPALLVVGAMVQQIMGGDRMHPDAHAAQRPSRHLLVQRRLVAEITAGAAPFLGDVDTQESEVRPPGSTARAQHARAGAPRHRAAASRSRQSGPRNRQSARRLRRSRSA